MIAMRVAARPADEDHSYGHGRFETLCAFVVGVILAAAGVMFCNLSLQAHWCEGCTTRHDHSGGARSDAWNDAVDILSALAASTAVAVVNYDSVRFQFLAADHYGGFVVGIVVAITGMRVLEGIDKVFARKICLQYHVDMHIEVGSERTVPRIPCDRWTRAVDAKAGAAIGKGVRWCH